MLLVARVFGMGHDGDAGTEQLGTRRRDHELSPALNRKADVVVRALELAILDLGLGDGRAIVDVPHHGRQALVGLTLTYQIEKGALRDPSTVLIDGGVLQAPVDGKAKPAPERLEGDLVFLSDDPARLDEVQS